MKLFNLNVFCAMFFFLIIVNKNAAAQNETYKVEMIDGVRHIYNKSPNWEKERLKLEFVQKYGEFESDDDNLLLFQPEDIDVDDDGNVYIVDQGNDRIQKFDSKGNYLLTIGRKGQGPGEFEYPSIVHITDIGHVLVNSYVRISMFDRNGKFIDLTTKNTGKRGMRASGTFRILDNDQYISTGRAFISYEELKTINSTNFSELPLFRLLNEKLEEIGTIGKQHHFVEDYSDNTTFNWCDITVDSEGNYYAAKEAINSIEKYSPDGKLLFNTSRKSKYKESKEIERLSARGGRAYAPMYNKFSKSIHCDGKQRLWVETYIRQYNNENRLKSFRTLDEPDFMCLEIYDNNGILLQRVPWEYGTSRELRHIENDRMFFVSWKDMCVYEYKIVEK